MVNDYVNMWVNMSRELVNNMSARALTAKSIEGGLMPDSEVKKLAGFLEKLAVIGDGDIVGNHVFYGMKDGFVGWIDAIV